jgi:carotenoid cleavage dioxygenase
MADSSHPYLSGSLTPVSEELSAENLPVTGEVPAALNGLYLRNGPNPMFTPRGAYHVFDGDGMLHGLWLGDGQAKRYRNRWVDTAWLDVEREYGKSCFGGMVDFNRVPKEIQARVSPIKNVANTHVVRHAGRILCLWEMGAPHEVDAELETVGPYDFGGQLGSSMTAHPHVDPTTGDLLFFGYGVFPPYLTFYRADASGAIVERAEIDIPDPVMMHDFAISERRVVFLDAPAVFNFEQALAGGDAFDWRPERGARFGVFDRAEGPGSIRWFETDPAYVFHFLNAWDDGDVVHVDGCRQGALNMGLDERQLADAILPNLTRWSIDLASGKVLETQLDDSIADFPRIDERRTGLRNRFGYVTGWSQVPDLAVASFDTVTKIDMTTGDTQRYTHGPGRTTSETIFAPDPGSDGEDDGWLLSFVHDAATDRSDVVILDARDLAAGPVATVHLPQRVPMGFHGSWLPGE